MAFIAAQTATDHTNTVIVTIPAAAAAGDRLFLSMTFRTTQPSVTPPANWTLVQEGFVTSGGNGKQAIYTALATSSGALDPGAALNIPLASSAPWTAIVSAWDPADVLVSGMNAYSGPSSVGSITTPSLTAPGAGILIHFYGDISGANPPLAAITWTANAATTEAADVGSNSGSGRQATQMVAYETVAVAGATSARLATPSDVVQGHGAAVLIGTAIDKPDVTFGTDQTVAVNATVNLTISGSGGAGAPFTTLVTHESGPATPTITGATTATPSFVPTVAGTYVLRGVATDSADVDSDPAFVTIIVVGSSATARPLSDVTTTGWTKEPPSAATYAELLADDDDATYVELENPTSANPFRVRLQPLDENISDEDYILWFRVSYDDIPAGASFTASLMEGISVIKTWPEFTWNFEDEVNYVTFTLVKAEYDAITNWAQLDVLFTPGD